MLKSDPARPESTPLTVFLEQASLWLILITSTLGVAAQYEAVKRAAGDPGNFMKDSLLHKPLRNARCFLCGPRPAGLEDYARKLVDENGDPFVDLETLFEVDKADEPAYRKLAADFGTSNPLSLSLSEWLHSINLGRLEYDLVHYITHELHDSVDVITMASLDNKSARALWKHLNMSDVEIEAFKEQVDVLNTLLHDSIKQSNNKNNPLRLGLAEWLRSLDPPLDQFEDSIAAHLAPPDQNPLAASEIKLPILALARIKRSAVNRMCEDGIFNDAELYTSEQVKGFEETFKQACKKLRHFLRKGFEAHEDFMQQSQIEKVGLANVEVQVMQAEDTPAKYTKKGHHPYVVVKLLDETYKTHSSNVSKNPSFVDPQTGQGESFSFRSPEINNQSELEVSVYDHSLLGKNTKIGEVTILVGSLPQATSSGSQGKFVPKWYDLEPPVDDDSGKPIDPNLGRGRIRLKCRAQIPKGLHTLVTMMHNHMDDSQVSLHTHSVLRDCMGCWIRAVNKHGNRPWSGGHAGEFVNKQIDQCNVQQLRMLYKFESEHKCRGALLNVIKTRILVAKIMAHPAVAKLTENTVQARQDAIAIAMHFNRSAELAEIVRVLSEEKEKADDMDDETSMVFHYSSTIMDKLFRCCTCQCRKKTSTFIDEDTELEGARSQREIRAEIEKAKAEAKFKEG
eukprot:COSAG02_NODE_6943_length_3272_cov_12.468704_1_plen_679_part_10